MSATNIVRTVKEKSVPCHKYSVTNDIYNYKFKPETPEEEKYRKEHLVYQLTEIADKVIQSIQNNECTWYNEYTIVTTGANDISLNPIYLDMRFNINYQTCNKLNKLFKQRGFILMENPHCQFGNDGVGGPDWIENVVLKVI